MGGQNLLNYGVGNNTPQQDRIPLVIVPVREDKGEIQEKLLLSIDNISCHNNIIHFNGNHKS